MGKPHRGLTRVRLFGEQVAYFATEAVGSFRRNGLMTMAAMTTVMVALVTVGAAVVISMNLTRIASILEGQVEVVAFLRDGLSATNARTLMQTVARLPGVASVRFVGRGEALARLQHFLGAGAFADLITTNPLPDSLEVRTSDAYRIAAVAKAVAGQPGVEEVTYGAQVVDRLVALTRGLRAVAALLTLFLAAVALTVVVNTIRLTVIARRQEIEIMQLVGATAWFIRWPLLMEGVLQGAGAAAAAAVFLAILYGVTASRLQASMPFFPIVPVTEAVLPVTATLFSAGVAVGAAGSLIAVRRFLSP